MSVRRLAPARPASRLAATVAAAATTLSIAIAAPAPAAESFVDTFDDGHAACWIGYTAWTQTVVESEGGAGGGPEDGWIRAFSDGAPDAGISTDKPEVGGDWRIAMISSIEVDVRHLSGSLGGAFVRLREGPDVNGWSYPVDLASIGATWTTIAAPVDPTWDDADAEAAGWIREGATVPSWQDTLASQYSLGFRAGGSVDLEMGYDNVTVVFDGPSCAADVNGDSVVGLDDLLMVLASWDACTCCAADIDRSRTVDFVDLVLVLSEWGACWEG